MVRLLGFVDIIAGLLFLASHYELNIPRGLLITVGIILILKGLIFLMNFFSWIDIATGIFLIFGFIHIVPFPILIGLIVFFALKGLASLLTFA